MFSNRAFNIAFLISLAWHLFCMSAVNVIVLPGKYQTRDLTSVSFLGPILGKTVLEIMLANKPVAVTPRYQHGLKYKHSFEKRLPLKDETTDEVKGHIAVYGEDNIGKIYTAAFRKNKEIPNITKRTKRRENYFQLENGIVASTAKREVIYKPGRPRLPSWITPRTPFTMELEFYVSVQGEVEEVIPVVSSGNPEVDLLAIRYLKGWKFAPLTQTSSQDEVRRMKFIFGTED